VELTMLIKRNLIFPLQ